MLDTMNAATLAPLELHMQELEDLEAPGWGDVLSWVGGGVVGGGATYYIGVATYAATISAT